jgi:hypothetical protein
MDSSLYTFRKMARAAYAEYSTLNHKSGQGCYALPVSVPALMATMGATFTSADEADEILNYAECPAVADLAPPFSPNEIRSLKLWLDASEIDAVDGAAVATWADRSGNGNNAVIAGAAAAPIFVAGAVKFNSNPAQTTILNAGNILGSEDFSIFVVGKYNSAAGMGIHTMISAWKKEYPSQVAISENNIYVLPGGEEDPYVSANRMSIPYEYNNTKTRLFSIVSRSNADGSVLIGGVNGAVQERRNEVTNMAGDVGRGFTIGGTVETEADTLLYKANVDVHEVLVFDNDITPELRQKVEGYLAHKWGLAAELPSDHPWVAASP